MLKKYHLQNYYQFIIFVFIVFIKFYIARVFLFENANIFQTAFVELGYLLIIFSLMELFLFKKWKKAIYITLNLVFSLLLFAIILYHDYFGYIMTIHAFSQLDQVGTIKDSVIQLVKPIYLLLFIDFIIIAILALLPKNKRLAATMETQKNNRFCTITLLIGVLLVGMNIFLQKDTMIANTVLAAEKQGILTYELLVTKNAAVASHQPVVAEEFMDEWQELMGFYDEKGEKKYHNIAKNKNIIVIQAEAFQDFPIHLQINGEEVTPFLNQLIEKSIYFPNVYQQIGPGNTSDAEFIFNTSLYPSAWTPTSKTFGDREIPSLPKLLKQEGYQSFTFHANDITFWNRNELYPALGFDKYYDIEFFGKHDVIGIGPSDEFVYQKALPELKKLYENNQKFYAQFVTLSSHHPFVIPDAKKGLTLPDKYAGTLVGDYLQSIHYTDQALEMFVNELKKEGMWQDTILVFYGDHFGLHSSSISDTDLNLLNELVGHDYTFLDQFNIPFIVAVGDQTYGDVIETVGGQIDMMPTIANMIGLSLQDFIHFGRDITNQSSNLFGMRYYMPVGSFFNQEIAFKTKEGFKDGEAYDIHTGEPITDFSKYESDYQRILKLEKLSDDYMNSLPFQS